MTIRKTASNAHMWSICEGYIHAANAYVEKYGRLPSPSADEGTMAHALAENALRQYFETHEYSIPDTHDEVIVPVDMKIKVRDYVDLCIGISDQYSINEIWIEHKFNCGFLDDDLFTRVDFACYDIVGKTLHVLDFKYGHRQVRARENPQLIIGAQSIIDTIVEEHRDVDRVEMTIYQPNGPTASMPVDVWEQCTLGVLGYAEALKLWYDSTNKDLCPGGHCHYCDARGGCEAVTVALYEGWDTMSTYNDIPPDFTAEQLEKMMAETEALKSLLRAHETGLEQMMVSRLKAGDDFPHWEYSTSLSDRKWDYPDEDIIGLGRSMGIDLEKKTLLSPKQAEVAGIPKEVINTLVRRDSTGLKLRKKSLKTLRQAFA